MTGAAVNFYSQIRAFKSENFIPTVLLAVCDNLSSEMNLLSGKGKGLLNLYAWLLFLISVSEMQ